MMSYLPEISKSAQVDAERSKFSFARARKPSNTKLPRVSQEVNNTITSAESDVVRRSSIGGLRNLFTSKHKTTLHDSMNNSHTLTSRSRAGSATTQAIDAIPIPSIQNDSHIFTRPPLTTRLPLKSASSRDLRSNVGSLNVSEPTLNHSISLSDLKTSTKPKPFSKSGGIRDAIEPVPLIRAYRQALTHGSLVTPVLAVDVVLRLASQKQISSAIPAPIVGVTQGRVAAAAKRFDKGRSKPLKPTPSPISRLEWCRCIFVLDRSGILSQYASQGPTNRLPEKIMQLGRDSVAHLYDAIPGKPWVIQVVQAVDEQGVSIQPAQSLLSRFNFRSAEPKRAVNSFLLVMETERDFQVWLNFIRKKIESLGGRKHWTGDEEDNSATKSSNLGTSYDEADSQSRSGARNTLNMSSGSKEQTLAENRLSFNPGWTMPISATANISGRGKSRFSSPETDRRHFTSTANLSGMHQLSPHSPSAILPDAISHETSLWTDSKRIGLATSTDYDARRDDQEIARPTERSRISAYNPSASSMPTSSGISSQVDTPMIAAKIPSRPLVLRAFPTMQQSDLQNTALESEVSQARVTSKDRTSAQSSENFMSRPMSRVSQSANPKPVDVDGAEDRQQALVNNKSLVGPQESSSSSGRSSPIPSDDSASLGDIEHFVLPDTSCLNLTYPRHSPKLQRGVAQELADKGQVLTRSISSCLDSNVPSETRDAKIVTTAEIMPDESSSRRSRSSSVYTGNSAFSLEKYNFPVPELVASSAVPFTETVELITTSSSLAIQPNVGDTVIEEPVIPERELSNLARRTHSVQVQPLLVNLQAVHNCDDRATPLDSAHTDDPDVCGESSMVNAISTDSELSSPVQIFVTPLQSPIVAVDERGSCTMSSDVNTDIRYMHSTRASEKSPRPGRITPRGLGILTGNTSMPGTVSEAARFSLYEFATKPIPEPTHEASYFDLKTPLAIEPQRVVANSLPTASDLPLRNNGMEAALAITRISHSLPQDKWESKELLLPRVTKNSPNVSKTNTSAKTEGEQRFPRLRASLQTLSSNQSSNKVTTRHISGPMPLNEGPRSPQQFVLPRDYPVPMIKTEESNQAGPRTSKSTNDIRSRVHPYTSASVRARAKLFENTQATSSSSTLPLPPTFQAIRSSSFDPQRPKSFRFSTNFPEPASRRLSTVQPVEYRSTRVVSPVMSSNTSMGLQANQISKSNKNPGLRAMEAGYPMKEMNSYTTLATVVPHEHVVSEHNEKLIQVETNSSDELQPSSQSIASNESLNHSLKMIQSTPNRGDDMPLPLPTPGTDPNCISSNTIPAVVPPEHFSDEGISRDSNTNLILTEVSVVDDSEVSVEKTPAETNPSNTISEEIDILENIRTSILSCASRRSAVSSSRSTTAPSLQSESKDLSSLDSNNFNGSTITTPESIKSRRRVRPVSIVPPIRALKPSRDSTLPVKDIHKSTMRDRLLASKAVDRSEAVRQLGRESIAFPRSLRRTSSYQPGERTSLLLSPEELSRRLGPQPTSIDSDHKDIDDLELLNKAAQSDEAILDSIRRMTQMLKSNIQDVSYLTPLEPPPMNVIEPLWRGRSLIPTRLEIHHDPPSSINTQVMREAGPSRYSILSIIDDNSSDSKGTSSDPILSTRPPLQATSSNIVRPVAIAERGVTEKPCNNLAGESVSHRSSPSTSQHNERYNERIAASKTTYRKFPEALPPALPPNIPLPPLPPMARTKAQVRRDESLARVLRSQEITAWTEDVRRESPNRSGNI